MPQKKSKRSKRTSLAKKHSAVAGYPAILSDISGLLESARRASARTVNAVMTATYWEIGRRIVDVEKVGREKAGYGKQLVHRLAIDLTARFGRGFGQSNLFQMRAFYVAYSQIFQTVSGKLGGDRKQRYQTLAASTDPALVLQYFPLPWSHYVRLLSIDDLDAREFYETEALRGGWSVRQLDRQVNSMFYERTALSRNKAGCICISTTPASTGPILMRTHQLA